MMRPTTAGWSIAAGFGAVCALGLAWGIGPWFFLVVGVAPAIVVALGRCRHRQTVWERRLPDGTRPVGPSSTAAFWTVCVNCGRPVAPINPREGASAPRAVGQYDETKAVASTRRARVTARRRQRVAAKRATWLTHPVLERKPAPPVLALVEGRKRV
jgi:hypothetical protein